MLDSFDISTSALVAQRTRLDVIAGNIANANTQVQADGKIEPFRRRYVQFREGDGQGGAGVHVDGVWKDPSAFPLQYDPSSPLANAAGYVQSPNVNVTMEYIDAMEATRAYEANVAMLRVSKEMVQDTVRLFA